VQRAAHAIGHFIINLVSNVLIAGAIVLGSQQLSWRSLYPAIVLKITTQTKG
jgi:hypothetical protein